MSVPPLIDRTGAYVVGAGEVTPLTMQVRGEAGVLADLTGRSYRWHVIDRDDAELLAVDGVVDGERVRFELPTPAVALLVDRIGLRHEVHELVEGGTRRWLRGSFTVEPSPAGAGIAPSTTPLVTVDPDRGTVVVSAIGQPGLSAQAALKLGLEAEGRGDELEDASAGAFADFVDQVKRRYQMPGLGAAMAARTTPERLAERRSVMEWVFEGEDPAVDLSPALNRAIAWSGAERGRCIYVPDGVWRLASRVRLVSGARVVCGEAARMVLASNATGLFGRISQADVNTAIEDVLWRGGVLTQESYTSSSGNVFGLFCHHLRLIDVVIDTFGGGRGMLLGGDNITVLNPRVQDPNPIAGVGGIRFYRGRYLTCIGGYVASGDDAIQFVPGATNDNDVEDGVYIGVTTKSFSARVMVIGLVNQQTANGVISMHASIRRCGFVACRGGGGARSISIVNKSSDGEIAGCFVRDCVLDGGDDDFPQAILVAAFSGPVRDTLLENIKLVGYGKHGLVTVSTGTGSIDGLVWRAGEASRPNPGFVAANIKGATAVRLGIDGDLALTAPIDGPAVAIGPGTDPVNACSDVHVTARIGGITDGNYGVHLIQATACAVTATRFRPEAGATNARGVFVATSASGCAVNDNDDSALPSNDNFAVPAGAGHVVRGNRKDQRRVGVGALAGLYPVATSMTLPNAALNRTVAVTASAGGRSLNVPTAPDEGDVMGIVKVDAAAGAVTLLAGGATLVTLMTRGASATLVYTGGAWLRLAAAA